MHLFDMNVGPLLQTHSGERIHFHFEDEVEEHEWEDLVVLGKLIFDIDLIAVDGGVDAIIKNLSGKVLYETYEYDVEIKSVERTFMKEYSESLPDDINPINIKGATINLGKVLREELLMQVL
ncbi:MAG: hypothetical protein PHU93_01470 [Candidatus Gracilibacteria bacterium]|nr:hypothetical protein [Candidatus Gracilibacteria bacterium]